MHWACAVSLPRVPSAWLQPWGTEGALSFDDTAPLRATLEQLVDFDLLNDGHPRLSVGAANIRKGNSVYSSASRRIGPEHIMASAALPPGFPPIQIDGEHYWDGGVVSNTPLAHLLDAQRDTSMLVFQVDLFDAHGARCPTTWWRLRAPQGHPLFVRPFNTTEHATSMTCGVPSNACLRTAGGARGRCRRSLYSPAMRAAHVHERGASHLSRKNYETRPRTTSSRAFRWTCTGWRRQRHARTLQHEKVLAGAAQRSEAYARSTSPATSTDLCHPGAVTGIQPSTGAGANGKLDPGPYASCPVEF